MAALSEAKGEILRTLVQSAPDAVLHNLHMALSADRAPTPAMQEVRDLVALEAADRAVRDRVLSPLLLLCSPEPARLQTLVLPSSLPRRLWRALGEEEARHVRRARQAFTDPDEPFVAADDDLCRAAADRLAAPSGAFTVVATWLSNQDCLDTVVNCLRLAPIARRASARMEDWTGRRTDERAAAARLAYRDAVAIGDDCGPLLIAMLMAHLEEPWLVLRLVSAVMDRPSDTFVAGSELAAFGEQVLDEIDAQLAQVAAFRPADGASGGQAAGRAVHEATLAIAAFDDALEMSRQGRWGLRLMAQKRQLASAVETRLKLVEPAIAAALPLQGGRKGKGPRSHPRLTTDPDAQALIRAQALTAFVPEVRSASAVAGFGALRTQVAEAVEERISQYVEDLLEVTHAQGPTADRGRLYLEAAAELLGLLTGARMAQIVRRRAAAA